MCRREATVSYFIVRPLQSTHLTLFTIYWPPVLHNNLLWPFFVKDLYFSVDCREDLYWNEAWLRAFIVTRIGKITSARVYLYLSSVYSILFIVYCVLVFVSKRSMIHSFYCCDNWLTTSAPVTGITWSQGHLSCVHIWTSHVLIEEKIQ